MAIQIKSNWDLKQLDFVPSDFDKELKFLTHKVDGFVQKWKRNPSYLKDEKVLKDALDDYEVLNRDTGTFGRVGYYYHLASSLDQNDPEIKSKENRLDITQSELLNKIRFFEHKLSKIPTAQQKIFLDSDLLFSYRHFLESIFESAKYILSEKEENIITILHKPAMDNWEEMTKGLLSKEKFFVINESGIKIEATMPELAGLMTSKNRKVRDEAAFGYSTIINKYVDVAESEINSILFAKKAMDDLRKSPRSDFMRLFEDDVDTRFADTLVEAVSATNDISADFYKLKANLLGQEKLEYHERNVEVGEFEKKYEFTDAVLLVEETLAALDPDFGDIFRDFVSSGRIDALSKQGKSAGGFFTRPLKNLPGFILLNHQKKIDDVQTLAHEMGHAIHYEYIARNQNSLNYDASLAIAEMASTFMEDFVLDSILKNLDSKARLTITMSRLNEDINSIHRQIACYKFEKALHAKFAEIGYLSKEQIGELFTSEMSSYMGPFVNQTKDSQNWWVAWPHIRDFFYVYSYASGLLLSKAFQARVRKDKSQIEVFKKVLAKGSSEKPVDTFSEVGIDLYSKDFWNQGLSSIRSELSKLQFI